MAIFAASRCLWVSLYLQSSRLLVSSLLKKRYRSWGPVRYVPGAYNQTNKVQKPPALRDSAEKDPILRKSGRVEEENDSWRTPCFDRNELQSSHFEPGSALDSNMCGQVEEFPTVGVVSNPNPEFVDVEVTMDTELPLEEEQNADDDSIVIERDSVVTESDEANSKKTKQDVENLAIELLAGRAFTALELRKKLRGKRFPLFIIDSVIADIKSRGLLNDGLYAESFSRSRWLTSNWGPGRIKQALIQKGVTAALANKATKHVFEEEDPNSDSHDLLLGMSKPAMDRLFTQASKQWLRGQDTSPENRKARIIRWLQYRGFNWGVTSYILRKLQAQYPSC